VTVRASRAWKYGDNVSTDLLYPGKYTYTLRTPEEIAPHALEDLDPDFASQVAAGDIVVGGKNWGCGSSREQAATCLVYNGVAAVIAVSFGRIFYRNAINNGLLAIVCPAAVAGIATGDEVSIDLAECKIRCPAGEFSFPPMSPTVAAILEDGGLIPHLKERLARAASPSQERS